MMKECVAAALLGFAAASAGGAGFEGERGIQLMAEKRYPEAVSALELESRLHPGSPDIMPNLGWAYWHAKRVDDAWRVGSTLVKLDPQNRKFLIFLANTDIERKDYKPAIDLMNKV